MCCPAFHFTWVRFSFVVTLGLVLTASSTQTSFGKQPTGPTVPSTIIPIEFPLSSAAEMRLTESLERLAITANGLDRPLVVLEFTKSKQAELEASEIGRNTPFERALGLARWLSGPRGSRIRSVAYLPKTICGHAVLVALSCEEIAIASDAEIGKAGIDEPQQLVVPAVLFPGQSPLNVVGVRLTVALTHRPPTASCLGPELAASPACQVNGRPDVGAETGCHSYCFDRGH